MPLLTNQKLNRRRKVEVDLISKLKAELVFTPDCSLNAPSEESIKHHTYAALMGQNCSILDVYIGCLTKKNPLKLKAKLEEGADKHDFSEVDWQQLQDLISESEQHLNIHTDKLWFDHLKPRLRWHDIAVWSLIYNLYGNEFNAMPDSEKFIYANIVKVGTETDRQRFLTLTGLLYAS